MYTSKEAIDSINEILNSTVRNDESLEYELTSYDYDWLKAAKSALERQISLKPQEKKITVGDTIYKRYHCPYCKSLLTVRVEDETGFVDNGKYKIYCDNCGQALDWNN